MRVTPRGEAFQRGSKFTRKTTIVGQLHIQHIGLAELIRRSTHIVVAVPDEPWATKERVAIKARSGKVRPYVRIVLRYHVHESLRGDLAAGAAIAVEPADDLRKEKLHRDYYDKGLSRHVLVDQYQPVATAAADQPRILCLCHVGKRFAFSVAGAEEGMAARGEIERLLDSKAALGPR